MDDVSKWCKGTMLRKWLTFHLNGSNIGKNRNEDSTMLQELSVKLNRDDDSKRLQQ